MSGVDKNKKFALLSAPFAGKGKKVKVRKKRKQVTRRKKGKLQTSLNLVACWSMTMMKGKVRLNVF